MLRISAFRPAMSTPRRCLTRAQRATAAVDDLEILICGDGVNVALYSNAAVG
jgi:hypothetical protein